MSSFKPIAIVSQLYNWENDDGVMERLVFLDQGIDHEIVKPEKKATFKLRAVKNGGGTWNAVVRLGGEKTTMILDVPHHFVTAYGAADYLLTWLENAFEIRGATFINVPNKKID